MKKLFVFCVIVAVSIFVIGCSGGSKGDKGETITDDDNNSGDTEEPDSSDTLPEQPDGVYHEDGHPEDALQGGLRALHVDAV